MNKYLTLHSQSGKRYGASCSSDQFISTPQAFLDVLAWGSENKTNLFVLGEMNFVPQFYDLKTGLAGEVFQKSSNYNIRLAIVGTFEMVVSERFRELKAESNRGHQVRFAESRDEAISWLVR